MTLILIFLVLSKSTEFFAAYGTVNIGQVGKLSVYIAGDDDLLLVMYKQSLGYKDPALSAQFCPANDTTPQNSTSCNPTPPQWLNRTLR